MRDPPHSREQVSTFETLGAQPETDRNTFPEFWLGVAFPRKHVLNFFISFHKKIYSGYLLFLNKLENLHDYTQVIKIKIHEKRKSYFQQVSSKITQIQEIFGRLNFLH